MNYQSFQSIRITAQACEKLGGTLEKVADGVELRLPVTDINTSFLADTLNEMVDLSDSETDEVLGLIYEITLRKQLVRLVKLSR